MVEVRDRRTLGRIRIRARGPQASSAVQVFSVLLFGPGAADRSRESGRFDRHGEIMFSGLPEGNYRLVPDTRVDTVIQVRPSNRRVRCMRAHTTETDFEFV